METALRVNDFQIITQKDLPMMFKKYWLPTSLNVNPLDLLYIKMVENHLEIGKADIKLIK